MVIVFLRCMLCNVGGR